MDMYLPPDQRFDTDLVSRMAGYYKGVQSAGAAVSFGMDAVRVRLSRAYVVLIGHIVKC